MFKGKDECFAQAKCDNESFRERRVVLNNAKLLGDSRVPRIGDNELMILYFITYFYH